MNYISRNNFSDAVGNHLPKFLFCPQNAEPVRRWFQIEFPDYLGDFAAVAIEPLYKMDILKAAPELTVLVRAISSDFTPSKRAKRGGKQKILS